MSNGSIWFRKNNGHWNGDANADPSTGVGGISLLPLDGPYFPVLLQNTGFFGGFQQNVNFGATPFAMPVPDGAVSWNAQNGVTTLNPSDKGGGVSLSNGNLTMSLGGSITGQGARGTTSISDTIDTLMYFESVAVVNPQNWAMGLANSIPNMSGTGGVSQFLPNVALLSNSGEIGINTVTGYSLHEIIFAGDIMCCVIGPILSGVGTTGEIGTPSVVFYTNGRFDLRDLDIKELQSMSADHLLTMRYSDNGGRTWSDPRTQTLGSVGEFEKSLSFRNIGQGRNKLIEVSWSAPRKASLGGGTILIEVAGS